MMSPRDTAPMLGVCFLLGVAFVGCDDDSVSGPVCMTEAVPALEVTVEEKQTGESVADAKVVAEDGAFRDSTRTSVQGNTAGAALAFERPGIYEVTVTKDGFTTWTRSGVTVEAGLCHPRTVLLHARLTPASG